MISQRFRALLVKEYFQILRDPSTLIIAVIFPALLLFMYGYGVSLDLDHLRIGLLMEETNPDAESFALSMRNSPYFDVDVSRDEKSLIEKLEAGKIRGIVVLPFYFSEFRRMPEHKGPLYVIADGSETNTANFVQNYVQGAWSNWLNQEGISKGKITKTPFKIDVEPRVWYNEELNSRNFLIPGSIALIMALIGTLLTALVISREWERGTMEALMSTPVTIGEIIWAKMVSYFCLGMISTTLCAMIAIFIYKVPFRGSFALFLLVSAFFLIASLATGLLISSIARNQFVASQISTTTAFLPAFMLSGFIFEITSMPLIIQAITYIFPARYMVPSLQTLFLVGNVWQVLVLNMLLMGTIAFILFVVIGLKIKKRLD